MTILNPVVFVARSGIGGLGARGTQAPRVVEVAAAAHDAPAVVGAVGDPLPDVAGLLLGAERPGARRVRVDRHRPAPAGLRRRRTARGRTSRPTGTAGRRCRAPPPPTRRRSAAARAAELPDAHAQNASASASDSPVAGGRRARRLSTAAGTARPVASRNRRTSALTTGQRPISSASSSHARSSPGSPSSYRPAGTSTSASRAGGAPSRQPNAGIVNTSRRVRIGGPLVCRRVRALHGGGAAMRGARAGGGARARARIHRLRASRARRRARRAGAARRRAGEAARGRGRGTRQLDEAGRGADPVHPGGEVGDRACARRRDRPPRPPHRAYAGAARSARADPGAGPRPLRRRRTRGGPGRLAPADVPAAGDDELPQDRADAELLLRIAVATARSRPGCASEGSTNRRSASASASAEMWRACRGFARAVAATGARMDARTTPDTTRARTVHPRDRGAPLRRGLRSVR